jgi:hypothetical protein
VFFPSDPEAPTPAERWPHIAKLLANAGHITIGNIAPVEGAAVAATAHTLFATILRRPQESFEELLQRLDHAIGLALNEGTRTNELKGGHFALATPKTRKRFQ